MRLKLGSLVLLCSFIVMSSCQSDYTKLVNKELTSGVQNNDIFYDFELGQTKAEFFDICWKYNKEKVFTHGPSNNYVQLILHPQDSTKSTEKIRMLFYGKFDDKKKMRGMDVKFSYVAWAPWNKDLFAEKLLPRVKDTLMKWYPGNNFMKVKDVLVKVDGNRQIRLKKESDQDLSVVIEDIEYKLNNLDKK